MLRQTLVLGIALVFGFGLVTGCGSKSSQRDDLRANDIDDGAEKYSSMQNKCPVCGGKPISADIHSNVNGKRVYFDKKECKEKFDANSEKYLKEWVTFEEREKRQTGGRAR